MEVVERVIKLYKKGKLVGYRVVFGDIAYDIYKDSFDSFATVEYICVRCLKKSVEKQELIECSMGFKTEEELSGVFPKAIWDVTNDIKGIKLLHLKLKMCLDGELISKEKEWRSNANLLYYFVDSIGYKKGIYVSRGSNGIKVRKMLNSKDYIEYTLTPKYVGSILIGVELEASKEVFKGVNYPYVRVINGSYKIDTSDMYYKSDLRRCRLNRLNIRSNKHYTLKNTDALVVTKSGITYKHKISVKLAYSDKECLTYLISNFNAS